MDPNQQPENKNIQPEINLTEQPLVSSQSEVPNPVAAQPQAAAPYQSPVSPVVPTQPAPVINQPSPIASNTQPLQPFTQTETVQSGIDVSLQTPQQPVAPITEQVVSSMSGVVASQQPIAASPTVFSAQPQPVVGGAESTTFVPTSGQNVVQEKQGYMLGIIAIISSILLGLIGLVIGIIAFIKGLKSKNKPLTILGGVAIFIGLAMTVVSLMIAISTLKSYKYSGKTQNFASTNCQEGKYSYDYPVELKDKQEKEKSILIRQIEDGATLAIIQSNCENIGVDISSSKEAIAYFATLLTSVTSVEDILPENVLSEFKSAGYTDITASSYKPYTNKNITSNSWSTDITASYKDKKVFGKLIFSLVKSEAYGFVFIAAEDVWEPNKTVWENTIQSYDVE